MILFKLMKYAFKFQRDAPVVSFSIGAALVRTCLRNVTRMAIVHQTELVV